MQLNFGIDTITAFGESVNLMVTRYGHYVVPITNFKRSINDIIDTKQKVTLTAQNCKFTRDNAAKFHRQFTHFT